MIERPGRALLCDGSDQEVTGATRRSHDEMSPEKGTKRPMANKMEGHANRAAESVIPLQNKIIIIIKILMMLIVMLFIILIIMPHHCPCTPRIFLN